MSWIKGSSVISFPGLGFEINPPEGVSFGSFAIQFYGLIIAIGLLVCCIYGLKRSKEFGLTQDEVLDGALFIIPLAIICARLYYCIFAWDHYKENPISILYFWEGGLAIYGGVIGAILGIIAYCKYKKFSLGAVLDLAFVTFFIGQAIGRWGNFFNREAYGAETESFLRMGLNLTETGKYAGTMHYYHPTFLYESLWNILGFVVLHNWSKRRRYDGQIFLGYVAWYGLGRAFIEGLRTDSLMLGSLRVSQLLAAVSCAIAVGILLWNYLFRVHRPEALFVNRVADKFNPVEETEEEDEEDEYEEDEEDEETKEIEET